MLKIKVIVEKHSYGCVAYPLGIKGVVVGEGDSFEDALSPVLVQGKALRFRDDPHGQIHVCS